MKTTTIINTFLQILRIEPVIESYLEEYTLDSSLFCTNDMQNKEFEAVLLLIHFWLWEWSLHHLISIWLLQARQIRTLNLKINKKIPYKQNLQKTSFFKYKFSTCWLQHTPLSRLFEPPTKIWKKNSQKPI